MGWRLLGIVGRAGVLLGLLTLSFFAFALWGTGLLTSGDQSHLRTELDRRLPADAAGATAAAARAVPDRDRRSRTDHSTGASRAASATGSAASTASAPPEVATDLSTPPAGQPVGSIDIPRIGLDMVVVQGVAAPDLALGPGHYPGTPLPGEAGNVSIAGHRTTYLHPFYNLTAVKPGTAVVLTTTQGVFVYVVGQQSVVAPTDVSVIGRSPGDTLTLTTCNPRYSAATRLVVRATLASSQLFGRPTGPSVAAGSTLEAGGTGKDPSPPDRSVRASGRGTLAGGSATGPTPSALLGVIGWGAAVTACGVATWWLGRRRRRRRWIVWLPGAVVTTVVLFFFYASLVNVVPASL